MLTIYKESTLNQQCCSPQRETLQTSQTEWLKRKNWESYEVQQFHDQIMAAVKET